MKTILCFGDSNTYGQKPLNPFKKERFAINERWTGVLKNELGTGFAVIEEGLNGRTTVWYDPVDDVRSGKDYLDSCLKSHEPIDLVILMLGTNDLKKRFSLTAYDIAGSIDTLINVINNSNSGINEKPPEILLICPPPLGKLEEFIELFEDAEKKDKYMAEHYEKIADRNGCHFMDSKNVIRTSDIDGVHFEKKEHEKLGKKLAEEVLGIFS